MPEHDENFPWLSKYGHYNYFETRMEHHNKVSNLEKDNENPGVYSLTRVIGDKIRIFVCDCYAYGIAEYQETIERLGQLDAIIINSAWCSYTDEAKYDCFKDDIGLFNIKDFMAALHRIKYSKYLNEDEKENFEEKGWI